MSQPENKCPLTPCFDTIVVERDPEKKETDGGIILPDKAVLPPWVGTIAAVSLDWAKLFKPGDRVLFRAYVGTEYIDSDKKVWTLISASADILAFLPSSASASLSSSAGVGAQE